MTGCAWLVDRRPASSHQPIEIPPAAQAAAMRCSKIMSQIYQTRPGTSYLPTVFSITAVLHPLSHPPASTSHISPHRSS